MLLTGE